MSTLVRTSPLLVALSIVLSSTSLVALSIRPVKVGDLYREADVVAVVRIMSGDSENYSAAVYKAVIVRAIKGPKPGEVVFMGPYLGLGVGNEYLAFLHKSEGMTPKEGAPNSMYGALPVFYTAMYSGYSMLEIEYACVFDGKGGREACDYGVKLSPAQVIVPNDWQVFPPGNPDAVTNYQKWVRRDQVMTYLERIASSR